MKVEEVAAALAIPSGVELQRIERLELHGVIHVLFRVDILYKIKEAMLAELDRLASNDGSWDYRIRDTILGRETVGPESYRIDNLAYEDSWDAAVYLDDLRVHQPDMLIHGPVEALDLGNVLILDRYVQINLHVSERRSIWFKIPSSRSIHGLTS